MSTHQYHDTPKAMPKKRKKGEKLMHALMGKKPMLPMMKRGM